MSSAKAGSDPLTLVIATAVDTVTATPPVSESASTTPQIHVHHFHHQSCLHHPEVLFTTLPTGAPVVSRSKDDYAVVFNSNNTIRSPFRPTLQPVNSKLSTVIFTAPRKTVCTATVRHPSLASLVFHQSRNTHSLEPVSPPNSPFFNNATGTSSTFPSHTSSPHFFPRDQPGASAGGSSTSGLHTTPTSVYAQTIPVNFVPERVIALDPDDPSVYYPLTTTNYSVQTATTDQQRGCPNTPNPTPSNNLTDRLLRWFRAGETAGGGRDSTADSFYARRRSKSQPPQHQLRVQLTQIDPRCVQAALEVNTKNTTKRNEPTQHQRPNGSYPAPSSRRRQLSPAPCTCSHHHQPQLHPTPQQVSFASPVDHQHRSHLPRWLFPCGPHQKHSLSPPPTCPLHVVPPPPPPPPRSIAVKLKPSKRNVEVQTQPDSIPACRCASTGIEPALFGIDGLTGCCGGEHKQHIMLHHYHFHHYYHCDALEPPSTPATNATTSTSGAVAEAVDSRPSSPLIKLSVNWPPNAAISVEEQEEEEGENGNEVPHFVNAVDCQADDNCAMVEQLTDGDPPAPVSDALRAIESAKVETPTGQLARPSFKVEDVGTRNKEPPTRVLLNAQVPVMVDANQTDQRRIFLQNINQLKRTGWYWGPLTIEEAELLLKDQPNGSFLVRDSGHELYILSVSFRAENRTYHTRIEHTGGKFGFAVQGDADTTSPSIAQFINHVIAESERGRTRFFLRQSVLTTSANHQGSGTTDHLDENHHVEARLLYPVSRFFVVHSLAHLCRFEILLKVRKDHIDLLPLPERLKKYLHERQYYAEFVQAYLESVGHLLPNNRVETREATTTSMSKVALEEDEIEDHV